MKSILLMKKGMLGDVLMMTPTIRRIKKLYPDYKLYVWSDPRLHELYENNPYIEGVNVTMPYDIVVDYDNKYDSTKYSNQIKFYLNFAQKFIDLKLDELEDDDYNFDLLTSKSKLDFEEYKPYVLFSPICRSEEWAGRELLDTRPYDDMRKELNVDGLKTLEVMHFGKIYGKCDYTIGPYSLTEYIDIIRNSKMVVTIDTGTLHIAQAFEIPTICIFGKVTPISRIIPKSKFVKSIAKDIPCIGCFAKKFNPLFCDNNEDCMKLDQDAIKKCYMESGIKNLISYP